MFKLLGFCGGLHMLVKSLTLWQNIWDNSKISWIYFDSPFEKILSGIHWMLLSGPLVATVPHDRLMYKRAEYLMVSGIRERNFLGSTSRTHSYRLHFSAKGAIVIFPNHDNHGPVLEHTRTMSPKLYAFLHKLS